MVKGSSFTTVLAGQHSAGNSIYQKSPCIITTRIRPLHKGSALVMWYRYFDLFSRVDQHYMQSSYNLPMDFTDHCWYMCAFHSPYLHMCVHMCNGPPKHI